MHQGVGGKFLTPKSFACLVYFCHMVKLLSDILSVSLPVRTKASHTGYNGHMNGE